MQQYVHFSKKQSLINQSLPAEEIEISLDYKARDFYIYSKLLDQLIAQTEAQRRQHCLDNALLKIQFFSTISKIQEADNLRPMRISDDGEFILPFGEVLYKFRCKTEHFFPIKLKGKDCFKNFPVLMKDQKGKIVSSKKLLFLEPKSRIIVPLGIRFDCNRYFKTQFRTESGRYIIYEANGITESSSKYLPLEKTTFTPSIVREVLTKDSLYTDTMIENWNNLIISSSKKETIQDIMINELEIDNVRKPGKYNVLSFMTTSTFIKNLDESFRRFGSYMSGSLFMVSALFFVIRISMRCMGLTFLTESTKLEKFQYFLSPAYVQAKKDQKNIQLTEQQEDALKNLLTQQKRNFP